MKTPAAVARIFDGLDRHYPDADTELAHRNAFELLVATMLSAQSTDARVNLVTPALFERFPDASAIARADTPELERMIHATGFFRQKAKALIGMATILLAEHRGQVPASMDALTALPGVGRKTANVVLGHALGVPGLPVDRHVLRVANRIGLAHGDDPVSVETQLCEMLPPKRWTRASDDLILHGRRICRPKPECQICNVRNDCDFFMTGAVSKPAGRSGRPSEQLEPRAARKPRPPAGQKSPAKAKKRTSAKAKVRR